MNLLELKKEIDVLIERIQEDYDQNPEDVSVSVQIDSPEGESTWSTELEVIWDNQGLADGCVIHGHEGEEDE